MCSGAGNEVANWAEVFIVVGTVSGPCREGVAEHRQPALGLLGRNLVLQDIPVLGQQVSISGPSCDPKPVAVASDFCGVSASEVVGEDERVRVCCARKHLATGPSCLLGILAEAAVPMRLHDLDRAVSQ